MITIEHTIDIPAAPADVWRTVTDTASYEAWNPFVPQLEGDLAPGSRITVTVRPGTKTMTFRPTLDAVDAETVIRWRGKLGVRGIFDGVHELSLEPMPDGGTRFTQRETFSGVLVPFLRRIVEDTAAGFADMNVALRDRVVATTRDGAGR